MTAEDLKNALLQEAVQGKLVPQIASEGNAKDLLEKIRKEKAKLVKEGKIKKEKPLPEITEEDIPFDIPENWCWCRLGQVCTVISGYSFNSQDFNSNSGIPSIKITNVGVQEFLMNETSFLPLEFENTYSNFLITKGDILIALTRSYIKDGLKVCIYASENPALLNQRVAAIKSKNVFVYLFLQTQHVLNYVIEKSRATNQPNLSIVDLLNLPFPLPPLAEQKRIVAAIEKFMPLIEEYGKKETELKAFNEQIGALTKKAILQEAVQGKLVPQIATEGTAKDLLEKIKKEKAKLIKEGKLKKEKTLPEITEDEIPSEIPENWCWCRLSELCNLYTGDSINETEKKIEIYKYKRRLVLYRNKRCKF